MEGCSFRRLPASPRREEGVVCTGEVSHVSSAGSVRVGEGLPSLWTQGDKVSCAADRLMSWTGAWDPPQAASGVPPRLQSPPALPPPGGPNPAPGKWWLKASKFASRGAREARVAAGGQGKRQVLEYVWSGARTEVPKLCGMRGPQPTQAAGIPQLGQAQAPRPQAPNPHCQVSSPHILIPPRLTLCLSHSPPSKQMDHRCGGAFFSSLSQLLALTCPFHPAPSAPLVLGG